MKTKSDKAQDPRLFTAEQLEQLREQYGQIKRLDPCGPTYTKIRANIRSLNDQALAQIEAADIDWISSIARMQLARRSRETPA